MHKITRSFSAHQTQQILSVPLPKPQFSSIKVTQMLVRFYGSNFRSLKDEFELSMVAADLSAGDDSERGVVSVPIEGAAKPLRLLRVAAIYGPNGSGKSTVLTAAKALRWMVTQSSRTSLPDDEIPPYEPFLLNRDNINRPVTLGCDVLHGHSILRYEITYSRTRIEFESLALLRNKDTTILFDRNIEGLVKGSLISRKSANQLYVKEMQPNVAVLSKLAQHGPSRGPMSIRPYYSTICNHTRWKDYSGSAATEKPIDIRLGPRHEERFAEDSDYHKWIMDHVMTVADIGITGAKTTTEPMHIPPAIREQLERHFAGASFPAEKVTVTFTHNGELPSAIDYEDESSGTRKLFSLSGDWWRLGHEPGTLFADELSASLHPHLLDRLIRSVNERPSSATPSQLVFTTHDTGLLEGRDTMPAALRRDQIYLTEKSELGATALYPLTDFKDDARAVHNLRKRYVSGLFGALPSADGVSL